MTISIVIRCKNEEEAIGRTLEKIRSQEIDIPYAEVGASIWHCYIK